MIITQENIWKHTTMKKLLTALVLVCMFLNVQAAYSIKAKEEPIDKTEFLNLNWWKNIMMTSL